MQYYISVGLFAAFVACVAVRAAMLRRRGIKAIVFGETDKSDFLLVPLVLAIVYAIAANAFGLPMARPLLAPFWASRVPGWVGVALCSLALIGLAVTLVDFGDSFRVGIDEDRPDRLVTTGAFSVSRNPIYVCFDTFFLGQFLIHRNVLICVAALSFGLLIHRQILREEAFLRPHYGKDYEDYCSRVRRYL